jgi:hypothetical protein
MEWCGCVLMWGTISIVPSTHWRIPPKFWEGLVCLRNKISTWDLPTFESDALYLATTSDGQTWWPNGDPHSLTNASFPIYSSCIIGRQEQQERCKSKLLHDIKQDSVPYSTIVWITFLQNYCHSMWQRRFPRFWQTSVIYISASEEAAKIHNVAFQLAKGTCRHIQNRDYQQHLIYSVAQYKSSLKYSITLYKSNLKCSVTQYMSNLKYCRTVQVIFEILCRRVQVKFEILSYSTNQIWNTVTQYMSNLKQQ